MAKKVFLGFGISLTSENVFKPKRVNSDVFCHKIKLQITRLGHAQWSWPHNERLVTNDVTSGISQSFVFYFACLRSALLPQLHFVCFFVEENSSPLLRQKLPELEGFRDSWLDVTTHLETQTLLCTDSWSISLGVAEAGTLNLDLWALKSQNPIFFLEYLLTHYRATVTMTIKTRLAV